jgi:transposase
MTKLPEKLPDDPETLKQLILELFTEYQDKCRRNEQLAFQLENLKRRMFGSRSEKVDATQLLPFLAELQALPMQAETPAVPPLTEAEPRPRGHGRRKPPAELPRKRIEYPIEESQKTCPECGGERKRVGEEITPQLEYIPAQAYILEHVRPKLACPHCQAHVTTRSLPPQPIEKGLPGPGMLAHVTVCKYEDHLPLNRMEHIFERGGLHIARSTMCDWVGNVADLLEGIWRHMKTELLLSKIIQTDDTPVKVQDDNRETQRTARLWVYLGDHEHPYILYDYTPNRSRDGPVAFLGTYRGYLQADGYSVYDGICAGTGVIKVACLAHVRRKFFEAKKSDAARALLALAFIRQIYDVEDMAKTQAQNEAFEKNLDTDAAWRLLAATRQRLRQERTVPIMAKFKAWLDEQSLATLPQSPLGEAITYARNQWNELLPPLSNGELQIDNNASERELRRIAIGRKNWMAFGSDNGGRRAAIIYSLLASCRKHGVNPFEYLRDVLARIPSHPCTAVSELTPQNWTPSPVSTPTSN